MPLSAKTGQSPSAASAPTIDQATRRSRWLKQLHSWHWISSAICLVGMLLFALTGITLNHAGEIEAAPQRHSVVGQLPAAELAAVVQIAGQAQAAPLPASLRHWLATTRALAVPDLPAEWSADEVYLALPRPGGDAWLRIDTGSGEFEYEVTDRGWISYFNDLHKGRHTGTAWRWFIDLFAVACLVFSISGLLILKLHAVHRPAIWPVVGLGAVLPALLAILFIH
ncbi:PepSY-associated TM helix domain-containing protein [Azonexus fungiphilus]|uniref:PepSY-associated TM helix domain-containing protein n=1 Tax=Azonexus fungiphilus TaxID=146940 RepID=UPI0034649C6B